MKQINILLVLLVAGWLLPVASFGQARPENVKSSIKMQVAGTSTMHDWEMKGTGGSCSANLEFDASGRITQIKDVNFSFPAKQLKSGKDAMDGNAYKALKTDKNPNITGKFVDATITTADNSNYKIQGTLRLQIGGVSKDLKVTADGKLNKDKSLTVKGEKKINMEDFKVEPPSFMFGSVKTGKDVTVKYDLTLN
jgi:polyisoprenoid-binding protein YceI